MRRREFLGSVSAGAAGVALAGATQSGGERSQHLPATVVAAPPIAPPTGKRVPFGWQARPIAAGDAPPLQLRWPESGGGQAAPTHLRIAVALDMRDARKVEVRLHNSGRPLGEFDIRYAAYFQPYELALTPADAAAVRREGVDLRLSAGEVPLWIFERGEGLDGALQPHLLLPGQVEPLAEFFDRLGSLASVQPFGWMEGCVLDGLLDLAELPGHDPLQVVARKHLDLFFPDGRWVYENHQSAPSDGRVYGIEGTLPFAALVRVQPEHPLGDLPVKFWLSRRDAEGAVIDGRNTTSEGSYTVAYPLARIARARRDEQLEQLAVQQLRLRHARLFDGQQFWRTCDADGRRGNRNWARGIAWQMLGCARTLTVLNDRPDIADVTADLARLGAWVLKYQQPDGLWSVFVDQPELTADTAGSAGIAAALAIGARRGWLPEQARTAAARTLAGLKRHLTPDGFLGGASQSNKGGEGLQRGSYRVLYQMAMGLMGQLIAAGGQG